MITIADRLYTIPRVTKEQATDVLGIANKLVNSAELEKFYEIAE